MSIWSELNDVSILLIKGLISTLVLATISIAIGICVGFCLGCISAWSGWAIRTFLYCLVTIVRGIPLVVQIFAVFFVLPMYGIKLSAMASAAIALSLFASFTIMEIVRAGIKAVPHEQYQAAISLGFSFFDTLKTVVLPQATRVMLPGLVNQIVFMVKATSVVSLFGVTEFLFTAKEQIERTMLGFEIMAIVWLIYTIICFPITRMGRALELRLSNGARGLTVD